MNKYGNALLNEYYGLYENNLDEKKEIKLFHIDSVETQPKSGGGYTSWHLDTSDWSRGDDDSGNDDGNKNCDNCGPAGTLLGIGTGIFCCFNADTVCRFAGNVCFKPIIESVCDVCC